MHLRCRLRGPRCRRPVGRPASRRSVPASEVARRPDGERPVRSRRAGSCRVSAHGRAARRPAGEGGCSGEGSRGPGRAATIGLVPGLRSPLSTDRRRGLSMFGAVSPRDGCARGAWAGRATPEGWSPGGRAEATTCAGGRVAVTGRRPLRSSEEAQARITVPAPRLPSAAAVRRCAPAPGAADARSAAPTRRAAAGRRPATRRRSRAAIRSSPPRSRGRRVRASRRPSWRPR